MSDEVPGGLVRIVDDEEDTHGMHTLDDTTLQSYTGGKNGDWSGKPAGSPLLKTVFSFTFETGGRPRGPLVQDDDGDFYGTTFDGPATRSAREEWAAGTVFKLSPEGELTTLHVFHGRDGAGPAGGLTKGRDGNFYGTTSSNGLAQKGAKHTTSFGTVFKITPSGQLTTLHYFGEPPDGEQPEGELVEGRDGNFYGVTKDGGDAVSDFQHRGTVYKITSSGSLTILHRFSNAKNDGGQPLGLTLGSDGNFYGTTATGGQKPGGRADGQGTVFRITPSGEFFTLHIFPEILPGWAESEDGKTPAGRLVMGVDGNLYGTTHTGGAGGLRAGGTIFKITPAGALDILYTFRVGRGPDGYGPSAGLITARDGHFYGTTFEQATVFKFNPPATLDTLYRFRREGVEHRNFGIGEGKIAAQMKWAEQELAAGRDHPEYTDGSALTAPLIEAADGTLWGTTEQGGIWDRGTVFRINPKALNKP